MGKRSNFEKIDKDQYNTIDDSAFHAIKPFLTRGVSYYDPCCGDGDLVDMIGLYAECVGSADIKYGVDALTLKTSDLNGADCIITNPPWSRNVLHPMIRHFIDISPYSWLLFDADWAHTKQSSDIISSCTDIVSIGRLKWIPGTTMSGKDNCAWYRFERGHHATRFHGR